MNHEKLFFLSLFLVLPMTIALCSGHAYGANTDSLYPDQHLWLKAHHCSDEFLNSMTEEEFMDFVCMNIDNNDAYGAYYHFICHPFDYNYF